MKVIEVNNKKLEKEFINVASYIYKDDKYWVRPLDIDIQNVFDKKKNYRAINILMFYINEIGSTSIIVLYCLVLFSKATSPILFII